jgi:translation initiation factor 2B subunit (eIF-2B alpha/beta/delta family)
MYELWSQYNETGNASFLPIKATYVSTLAAWASSGRGNEGAERAEAIWEEMERLSSEHEHLGPTTICANIVLNAWSKSGARGAGQRCESILARMEALYFDGRLELKPSTTSFNTVIDALARSHEHGSEQRAEALLEHMDELSSNVGGIQPDNLSFNTVLNCWSRSRVHGAAHRAEAILRHMEQRYADGTTDIQPDAASYNTVMAAWSRTRAREASNRAQQVLQWMEDASNNGNEQAKPNAISYNIFINVLAKSNDPRASDRALETLDKMKKLADEEGREDARPDVFTYTSLLDTLAKRGSVEAAERAELVLEELETAYSETDSRSLKPNIRTYTSVVHAIARSRTAPERAERIVSRLERMYESGDGDVQPDVVCYDALINAFGWSNLKGKAQKCFDIYQKMLYLYQSRKNPDAKPDIITCNSVLNACAFDQATTESERQAIMAVAVQTLEHFQSSAPKFGRPNHITYANLLLAIEKHMPVTKEDSDSDSNHQGEHRSDLAEATFWQACQSGSVSVLVVKHLDLVLPWHRLSAILGPALLSTKGEALRFSWHKLPREWTKYAPDPKERRDSRPSRRQAAVAVTKSAMASSRRKESKS